MQVRLSLFCLWSCSFLLIVINAAAQAGTPGSSSIVTKETCGRPSCIWNVFGPQVYQRQAGEPQIVRSQFSVLNPRAVYTLRLQESEASDPEIRLNGKKVLDRDDFREAKKDCGPDAGGTEESCFSNESITITKRVALDSLNTLEVAEQGLPVRGFTLSIFGVDPGFPSTKATVTPPPNSSGRNHSPVTVAFTCADLTSGIASCPAPITISSEGLNQPVSGVVLDRAGNSATAHLQVSLDSTPPIITLLHPGNGQTVASSTVNVNGSLGDGLSGIDPASVTCNGLAAFATAASFACNVPLTSGTNLVVVQARDRAGNPASSSFSVASQALPVPAPSAIFFTPPMTTMLSRQTHTVALLGDQGQTIHGAAVASSDPKVVAVSGDGTFILRAVAAGSATVTASLNELRATLQVTVLPGKEFPSGTRLFSVAPQPGNALAQVFSSDASPSGGSSGAPGANGPAFFAVEAASTGEILRAMDGNGAQMWSTPLGVASASPVAAIRKPGLTLGLSNQDERQNP